MEKRKWEASTIDGHFHIAPNLLNEDMLTGQSDIYLYDENGFGFGLLYADLDRRDVLPESILDGQKDKAKLIAALPDLIEALVLIRDKAMYLEQAEQIADAALKGVGR